ncbi:MAG: membrane integrity-associated transporter subunit PqiC [Hyphomicrobiales bacterium]|nr:membrane integrity-associated transporter subunit PqiC [Hyphomicrobiales bacterium]MDE2114323.1 membrane integrity-associated transporter subunit PqiC [Hyphomicrobiales bacterium]
MGARVSSFSWFPGRRHAFACLFLGLVSLDLSGCASAPPPATFDLTAAKVHLKASSRQVYSIAEPTAILPYDSDRVVVRTGPEQVAYLTGAQWVDKLPLVLQRRLIASFDDANLARNVGGEKQVAGQSVAIDIRRFEINALTATADVELSVKVMDALSGRILATKVVSVHMPAPVKGASAMVAALNDASVAALSEVVTFVAAH